MREGARAAAAIEILSDVEARHRPAADAVKDWMLSHRFAGSKDRAAIGDIVFGALRWRSSSAFRFGEDGPRSWVLGALRWGFAVSADDLIARMEGDPHAPAPLSEDEVRALREGTEAARLQDAPAHVRGDFPDWLDASFTRAFGETRAQEGAALAAPAPLDLRANMLKTTRENLIAALAENPRLSEAPTATPYAPHGVRIPWAQGRTFPWASDQAFVKGWFEVQDEGSQLAALACGARPGLQIADVCAGGGGKTLALAAAMDNKGQVFAYDVDGRRLAPVKERSDRAGARNIQIRAPLRSRDALEDLNARMDVVIVDAPCTGSGTWRRNPESKWRLKQHSLDMRQREQREALALGARLVKPGGRLVYVTCSVLPEENEDIALAFARENLLFAPIPLEGLDHVPVHKRAIGVQMTPLKTGCDGFYVATFQKSA